MLNLAEYRPSADRLADHLPWAALVAPGVVLNKDGSFQRTLRFRGPDLDSATEAELVSTCARANNVLRRFGTGWALFFEAERAEALGYPNSRFPDPASWLVDEERRAAFEGKTGRHFESHYHLTLLYLPPDDQVARAENALLETGRDGKGRDWRQDLAGFVAETERVLDLLAGFMPEVRGLGDAETLTYLHGTISTKRHPVAVPEIPLYLDGLLVDTPLTGGIEPMLGDTHLRTLTILGFPNLTRPGILDALNHQDFAYRWVTRFIALDKAQATRELTKLRRHWFAKRKSIAALLREVLTNEPVQLLDSDADNKVADADLALQALGGDHVAFGHLTTTITVSDEDRTRAEEKVRAVERIVNGLGFTCIRETVNAVEAWLGSLPGHVYANVRQPLVHTLNLAHLMPLSSVWAGPARNDHLDGPPLLTAETSGSTPFRLSTHVGDVGHLLIVGPTGAGKSVLLALLALQFRRYAGSQVTIFDKGNSARAAILAMGGAHHALGAGSSLAFQPLRRIDDPAERAWAAEWVAGLLAHEKVAITPEVKEAVWSALTSLASAPPEERTLTGFVMLVQSNALKAALMPYTLEGPFGRLLDAAENSLALSDVQCFETEELMHQAGVVAPVLTYLFHRLEERFDGRPTLLILDEAWVFLDNPLFAARIREWLKVLRKKNVSVVFATQSLADIAGSSIAPAIIESCPQRLFLPNDRAVEPLARAAYERFGLNERQIELIARATPKRHYYLQSRRGNRLFELALGPVALALCGASSPDDQSLIDRLSAAPEPFLESWLTAKGLSWAVELITENSPMTLTYGGAPASRPGREPAPPGPCMNSKAEGSGAALPSGPGRQPAAKRLLFAAALALPLFGPPAAAQMAVFDGANYTQNLLAAARALEQVTNQIRSLQNEAAMLENMARHLQSLDVSSLGQINAALSQINGLMAQAQGIAFTVGATDAAFQQQFPSQYGAAVTTDQSLADARTRWQNTMSAYRQTLLVQAQVDQNVQADAATLTELVTASQGAVGSLQAQQAANQLIALSAKQQMQIQTLMAAQYRAEALDQARKAQDQAAAQAATARFLGSGTAYTPQ